MYKNIRVPPRCAPGLEVIKLLPCSNQLSRKFILLIHVKMPTTTLENHCARTAQSSRGGCSRRVHKIVYLAVKKGNILVIFFTSENCWRFNIC